jgi:dihydroorotate dehydrogenase (NAD+) catalytic subunit
VGPGRDPDADPSLGLGVDLGVDLGRGLLLAAPIIGASGAMGYGKELDSDTTLEQLGAVTTRSITLRQRGGNPSPRMVRVPAGLLNGIGLQNPGVEAVLDRYAEAWARLPVPIIVSLAGDSVAEFTQLAQRLDAVPGVAALELNLSSPDHASQGRPFALDAAVTEALVGAVRRATELPVLAKLSPAAPDPRVVARAAAAAGADAIVAVNTLPGLALAPDRTRPALGSIYGGISGPALRPLALRVVYEVSSTVRIPVVAMGGVSTLSDVLDFLAAGASVVGVGTAALADPSLPGRLIDELADDCRRRGLPGHRALVGTAITRRGPAPAVRGSEYRL